MNENHHGGMMKAAIRRAVGALCVVTTVVALGATYRLWRQRAAVPRLATAPAPARNSSPAVRPSLWLLAVGVSRYLDATLNLAFAEADARAVAETFAAQHGGRLYGEARTMLLTNEQVTRETILDGIERFLGQAGPEDVAVIFMAGHGLQDRATGSYYFLPHPASAHNLLTAGLRMSDFDEMLRVLRRNVGRVVVMLDTCHSGALRLSGRSVMAGDDLAARLSTAEGLYLLAATKPGEESREKPEFGHGVFTYALLEGLRGAADADADGLVSVGDLFGHVARSVPRLTEGRQHPYHKSEGTDLTIAAVLPAAGRPPASPPTERVVAAEPTVVANVIGVTRFRNLRGDPDNEWIGDALRTALITELTKVQVLRVLSPDAVDRSRAGSPDDLQGARQLGVGRLVTGSFAVLGETIRIDAAIVDPASAIHQGSESVQGNLAEFFDLEKELVVSLLRQLPVEVSSEEIESIRARTTTSMNAYRLLLEAEGVGEEEAVAAPTPERGSATPQRISSWFDGLLGSARAAEPEPDREVAAFLEAYRQAHEHKDIERIASLYVALSEKQRNALKAYFDNAEQLAVDVVAVRVEPQEGGFRVSYTRRDTFIDKETGKPAEIEVRLNKTLVRDGGSWKIDRGG